MRRALRCNAPFIWLVGCYVGVGLLVFDRLGRGIPYSFSEIYYTPAVLTGLYLATTLLLVIARDVLLGRRRPSDPETWRHVWGAWLGPRRLVNTLVVLAVLPALMDVMIGFRQAITFIQPFTWDEAFMRLDLWLHAGRHPWEWIHPLVGNPGATRLLDSVYVYGWFGALWLGVIWQAVHGREPIRSQFLLTFALAWIVLGTAMAIAFSSAGPVYFASVSELADPYAALMEYLRSIDARAPLHALENQERLWASYTEYGGVTAMPSMHLAIATIVVIAAVRTHSWLGVVCIPLLLAILVGSVHLGWHYAVDSYAGIAGGAILWWIGGLVTRWWQRRLPSAIGDMHVE